MKTLLAAMLLLGFVGLAIFGFIEINSSTIHSNGEKHRGCLASVVQNTDCPNEFSDFGSAFFHIAAFKFFSALTLETILWLLAILASLATVLLANALGSRLALVSIINLQPLIYNSPSLTLHLSPLLRWLALKELSPTR